MSDIFLIGKPYTEGKPSLDTEGKPSLAEDIGAALRGSFSGSVPSNGWCFDALIVGHTVGSRRTTRSAGRPAGADIHPQPV